MADNDEFYGVERIADATARKAFGFLIAFATSRKLQALR
jgi:hypothetical protein